MIVGVTTRQVGVTPDIAFKRGVELHQSGDLLGAEKIYRAILKQYPKHFETLAKSWISAAVRGAARRRSPNSCAGRSNRNRIRRSFTTFSPGSSICSTVMTRRCNEPIARLHSTLNSSTRGLTLAQGLAELGRYDEALAAMAHAIELAPDQARLYHSWGEITRWTSDDPRLAALEELARKAASLPVDDQVNLNFALGKAYADCGDIERAFRRQIEGGALQRRMLRYDEASTLCELDALCRALDAKWMTRHRRVGDPVAAADIHPRDAALGDELGGADPGQPPQG